MIIHKDLLSFIIFQIKFDFYKIHVDFYKIKINFKYGFFDKKYNRRISKF